MEVLFILIITFIILPYAVGSQANKSKQEKLKFKNDAKSKQNSHTP